MKNYYGRFDYVLMSFLNSIIIANFRAFLYEKLPKCFLKVLEMVENTKKKKNDYYSNTPKRTFERWWYVYLPSKFESLMDDV